MTLLCLFLWAQVGWAQKQSPKREFRAVWIATINNIDWPSNRFISIYQQKEQYKILLNHLQKSGINAVIVQVRPAADAFYNSRYEPWSEWLTGTQGKAPSPYYDPLEFMLKEAHQRGMELHAWINPYRAVANVNSSNIHESHITKRKPEWFLRFGNLKIFNPGIPEARRYIINVITDIISRYDVDGIHFDDYFYPYPSNEHTLNDGATFAKYKGNFKRKSDWRRNNVSMFIRDVHKAIQKHNPRVKLGVSPYGVWRNSNLSIYGSETTSGLTSYDHLHADVRLWLKSGWIDYVTPQLYQNIKHKNNPYKTLVSWWSRNVFGKHLYIGHATYRLFWDQSKTWYDYREMPNQVRYLRRFQKVAGSVFYSSKSILQNKGSFRDSLRADFYKYPALIPPMLWKDSVPPLPPRNLQMAVNNLNRMKLTWEPPLKAKDGDGAFRYVIYRFKDGENINIQNPKHLVTTLDHTVTSYTDWKATETGSYTYLVTALDKLHNESEVPELPKLKNEEIEEDATAKKWSPNQPMSEKHPTTYKEAGYFYQLMIKGSKEYFNLEDSTNTE